MLLCDLPADALAAVVSRVDDPATLQNLTAVYGPRTLLESTRCTKKQGAPKTDSNQSLLTHPPSNAAKPTEAVVSRYGPPGQSPTPSPPVPATRVFAAASQLLKSFQLFEQF
mmetsp:Transcript_11240/g.26381  ORF Transcript_11240/g.26381 Transcript_11240/m.26381 type:complete len:112 (-) Transcript_11240:3220-3555(-)